MLQDEGIRSRNHIPDNLDMILRFKWPPNDQWTFGLYGGLDVRDVSVEGDMERHYLDAILFLSLRKHSIG